MEFPGYTCVVEVMRDARFTLYRGQRKSDGLPRLLKTGQRDLIEREFELLRELPVVGVPRAFQVLQHAGRSWLVLEDRGLVPLSTVLANRRPGMEGFFKIAIALCAVLAELHSREIIHGNVNPHGILADPDGREVQLADFSLAGRQSNQEPALDGVYSRGLLAYVSPEQTGRMNRVVDYRTDFYSLGATLYEMLTGRPPFCSEDPLEVIHSHIARQPVPPSDSDPAIPSPVPQIVMRLLAKTAEERYRSALGLQHDFEVCEREWLAKGAIAPFALGQRDVSDRFLIPQKLYGRDGEVSRMLAAFEGTCGGRTSLLLITGYSGIGKTSLIQELCRPIVRHRGYFTSGKFEQIARNTPYSAVVTAFRTLVNQLLTESEDRLTLWRSRLSAALAVNGGVIAEVIPEIELVLGKQALPVPLGPVEAHNRFRYVFQSFVAVLAQEEHPLVVFLDDLQWADPATLELLDVLLADAGIRQLLLIGAYRDNEVDAAHPLMRALDVMSADGVRIERLSLAPLALADLRLLLRDTLHGDDAEIEPLARLILLKTDGNPFFVIQFLKTLHQEGLFVFDREHARWNFSLETIAGAPITDNVADMMTKKIRSLSPDAQTALTLAACMGNRFEQSAFLAVTRQTAEVADAGLGEAARQGLLLRAGAAGYSFLHDRVQQAAYGIIAEPDRPPIHLQVGRLLLAQAGAEPSEGQLFEIANHLNLGRSLITDPAERLNVARLNLAAGRKAQVSAAYRAAADYLESGIALTSDRHWETHYELMLELHLGAAECAYLAGNFEKAEQRFDHILARAVTNLDRAQVYSLRIVLYENMSRYAEAVASGKRGLALFGIAFPESAEDRAAMLDAEIGTIQALLGHRPIASLIELPVMTDPDVRMIMGILTGLWAPSYILGDQILTRILSATMVRLSLLHGNAEESAYGYVTHAITAGPVRGDYRSAYEWGELALGITDRFNDRKRRAKIHQQFNAHVSLWRRPLQECIPHAREACRSGLEAGDFTYAGYATFTESWAAFLTSPNLDRFVRDHAPSLELLEKIRMAGLVAAQNLMLNWARALQGRTVEAASLSYEDFRAEEYAATFRANPFFMTFYLTAKVQLHVMFQEYARAAGAAEEARKVIGALGGTIWPVLLDFWGGLADAALYRGTAERDRVSLGQRLQASCERLGVLAESCPENFRCFSLLLTAEMDRIAGNSNSAVEGYEQAIRYARQTGNLHSLALANELCANFWIEREQDTVAAAYIGEAQRLYLEWGAVGKVKQMHTAYGGLLAPKETAPPKGAVEQDRYSSLDFATVLKAAHAIAVEIELESLLGALMKIALENAGANRGVFLQETAEGLAIQAEAEAGAEPVMAGQPLPLERATNLSQAVVRFVARTGQDVVAGNAAADDRFEDDLYVRQAGCRSILCVPVLHQGRLGGILYLENNLTTDAFTSERIETMRILSVTAAIALEQAQLYRGVKEEVARRRRAEEKLKAALAEVQALKKRLEVENVYLRDEIRREHNFEEIVGNSPALLDTLQKVEMVAPTDSTVLICGETGTGKEMIARAVHDRSRRRSRPLVKVNCGAISAGLVESELFGHVKGAFTGALDKRIGRFEVADGGTLFLDEVSELPPETQVKLLRVLQEGEFEPVGSSQTRRVDVRLIAASNRDLAEAVAAGRFRSDLFYRLNVFPVQVPPLRDRRTDIPQLVAFFLGRFARQFGKRIEAVPQETMDLLSNYFWPGNIRELRNLIERAVVLSTGPVLRLDREWLPAGSRAASAAQLYAISPPAGAPASLEDVERRHITSVLEQTGWVIEGDKGAATVLNLHPNTLRSRMKKLGIQRSRHGIS